MSANNRQFWVFSFAKGAGSKAGEEARWAVDVLIDDLLVDAIRWQIGEVRLPPRPCVGRAERPGRIEDVPWVYRDVYVVSEKVRMIVEEMGPGDCQFIPIDIRFGRKSLGLIYWIMHLNHTLDCADPIRSLNANDTGEDPLYYRSTIMAHRVPPHVSTFRVKYGYKSAIMRDTLRRRLVRAKVTGCMFYPP
ncbi:MAG: hypothetical protein KF699_14930 [Phycisphaeraceae bacterium]|nr:hypothetical protein [Phycisphaeraceae bacterium]